LTADPELGESQRGHDRVGDFQDDLASCPNHLGRDVDHHAPHRGGVTGHRQHLDQHILLEGLREEEGDQHAGGERGIGWEPLEGERLDAKIFQPTMREFIRPPAMMAGNEGLRLGPVDLLVDRRGGEHHSVHAQVCQDDIIGTGKVQQALPIRFRHGSCRQRPVVPRPALAPPPELQILPLLVPIVIDRPLSRVLGSDIRFDRRGHLAGHDDAPLQFVTSLQDGFIEKATVEADDDHHVSPTGLAHQGDHPLEHIDHGMAGIAVLASATKHRVHNFARPDHLQGLKTLTCLYVGWTPCRFGASS